MHVYAVFIVSLGAHCLSIQHKHGPGLGGKIIFMLTAAEHEI